VSEAIKIATLDGIFSAYTASPDAPSAPAIGGLHEVFGVNADMRETCHQLVDKGYIAICPDPFCRQEPGLDLSHWRASDAAGAFHSRYR
jgi:carboxymethylenebutenolidase